MRRLLNPVFRYLEESARVTAEGWDAFWFTPADPTLLGVLRILTGLMLLYTHAVWGLVLGDFFGPGSWLSEPLVRALQEGSYIYSFWWLVPQGWIWPAYGLSMVVLAMFTLGLWTRDFDPGAGGHDLVCAPGSGSDLRPGPDQRHVDVVPGHRAERTGISLDRWLAVRRGWSASARPEPSAGANLALRLINVHMCVIYFFAGTSKLQGTAWWNGEAMWRAFANLEYQSIDLTWLAWHPRLLDFLTHVSVLWEVSFCALIWLPRLRPLVLAMAIASTWGSALASGCGRSG